MTVYARPGADGSLMSFKPRYDNFIGGQWVAPVAGRYFENPHPGDGPGVLRDATFGSSATSRTLSTPPTPPPPPGARPPPQNAR